MADLRGKKIVVLAGQDVHRKVVETAKKMGVYTIVADYLENSSAKKIADETSMVSIIDTDAVIKLCKEKQADGIVNFCNDLASKIVQQVNQAMGWPNIGTWEQVCTLTDKALFKQACVKNGVDIIKEYSVDEVKNGKVKFPVLVKPNDSRGSRGSTICDSKHEFDEALKIAKENSDSDKVIIEQYMAGHQELSITYVVIDGEPHLISVADRHSGRREDNVDKILSCMMQPSWFIETYLKNVDANVKKMIKNIGIQNSAVFMQGFVDGDTVRMFDPGIRFPGNEYERLYAKATGVNPMNSIITYALTGKMNDYDGKYEGSYDINGKAGVQYMINCRPGIISKYVGIEKVEQHPNVVYVGYKYDIGEKIENTGDTKHRVFDISFLVDRTVDAVNEVVDFVNDNLQILDENGKNMIVSPYDFRKVKHLYNWPEK